MSNHENFELRTFLELSFPGICKTIECCDDALGFVWEDISKPFCVFKEGTIRAHAGVITLPCIVEGKMKKIAAIHAVCVHPEHRGGGFGREVMQQALEYTKCAHDNTILFTNIPVFYEKLQFHPIQEHYFRLLHFKKNEGKSITPLRVDDENHVKLLRRLLVNRVSLSSIFFNLECGHITAFNTIGSSYLGSSYSIFCNLYYIEELDSIIWCEKKDGVLKIFDIFTSQAQVINLHGNQFFYRILDYVGASNDVFLFFTPDLLNIEAEAIPYESDEDVLMTLHPSFFQKKPFMIPFSSRC